MVGKIKMFVRDEVLMSDAIAIADDRGNKITYKELVKNSAKLPQSMQGRNLIFALCDHHFTTLEFLYESLYRNIPLLLLASDIDIEMLCGLIEIYKPQYIFCCKEHEIKGRYSCEIAWEKHILLNTGECCHDIHSDAALFLTTSGSTGSPKLVKLSYANLYEAGEIVDASMGIYMGQKGLSPLPVNHVYGLGFCLWHWHCGATLLVSEEVVFSKQFNEFFEREKVNHFAAIPYTYQMLFRVGFWNEEKLENLNWAMSAGAKLTEQDQMKLVSVMKDKFWSAYGQTECTGVVTGMNFQEDNIQLGSVGRACGSVRVSVDAETNELIIRSGSVCMGYVTGLDDLAEGDFNKGVIYTGDVALIDDDGCIYLKGRLSRYVKVLGKRIGLDEIEKYLENKIAGLDCACVGLDDNISVFCSGADREVCEKIYKIFDNNIKIPRKFVTCSYLERIPRNETGKVLYGELDGFNERKNIGDL